MSGGKDECDACLAKLDVARLDALGWILVLTVTVHASHLLPSRPALVEAVRRALRVDRSVAEVDAILRGLES